LKKNTAAKLARQSSRAYIYYGLLISISKVIKNIKFINLQNMLSTCDLRLLLFIPFW